jgi:hypothetical protein
MGGVTLSDEQNGLVDRSALWLHLFRGRVTTSHGHVASSAAAAESKAAPSAKEPNGREGEAIAEAVDALCSIGILELINPTDATEKHRYRILNR